MQWEYIAIAAGALVVFFLFRKIITRILNLIARTLGVVLGSIFQVVGMPVWLVKKARESRDFPLVILILVLLIGGLGAYYFSSLRR